MWAWGAPLFLVFSPEFDIFAHFWGAIFRQALLFLLQFTDEDSNSIFIIQTAEMVFYPCFEIQFSADKILEGVMKRADLRWQLYDRTHQCQRKATAPTSALQAHFQLGMMAERNLVRAGGKITSGKQRGKRLLFPRLLVGTGVVYFTKPRYFKSQKGVTTSGTNPNSDFCCFVLWGFFKQCQCQIHFPQEESKLSRTGWCFHQRTKNRFGTSQKIQTTSESRGEPHPGLTI